MWARNYVIRCLALAAVALVTCSCVIVTLAPGAENVKLTHWPADVAACKPVGNVFAEMGNGRQVAEYQLRNRTVGLDGNALFYTGSSENEGIAYRCP